MVSRCPSQAQALVVGFLAAVAAMVLGWIPEGKFDLNHAFLLSASSVLTASFASFVLGTLETVGLVQIEANSPTPMRSHQEFSNLGCPSRLFAA